MAGRWLLAIAAVALAAGCAARPSNVPHPATEARTNPGAPPVKPGRPLTVALTFDDLPVHGVLPEGTSRAGVARAVVAGLAAHHAPPTYGFVNAKGLNESPENVEVLRIWRAAGHPLGNHTWSHMDLDQSTPGAFEQDIVANEATLREFMGTADWHWFRFPYLHEGNSPEKRLAVADFLARRGYRTAPVTIMFGDWASNDPYARCVAANDRPAIEWMKGRFLQGAGEALAAAADGPGGVLLLHLGAFDALMLPPLLELLEARGVTLVPLEAAVERAAGERTATAAAARVAAIPLRLEETMAQLDRLCR